MPAPGGKPRHARPSPPTGRMRMLPTVGGRGRPRVIPGRPRPRRPPFLFARVYAPRAGETAARPAPAWPAGLRRGTRCCLCAVRLWGRVTPAARRCISSVNQSDLLCRD